MIKLWLAKRQLKRVEYVEKQLKNSTLFVKETKKMLSDETEILNKKLKKLTVNDFEKFKSNTGYI